MFAAPSAGDDVVAARVARFGRAQPRLDRHRLCFCPVRCACWPVQFLLANNQAVAKTFFFVPLMVETFPLVLKAFWINVEIFTVTEILVLIWGLVVALAMLAPGAAGKPLRIIAAAYVDIFRAIPAVLVIYLVGFGVPLTGVPILKDLSLTAFVIVALTLTVGAYVAEIYRAGIQSIHWSQTAAARSLGLSYMQTLRFVILPQGIRQIIPPLLNAFIALAKGHGAGQRCGRGRFLQPVHADRHQPLQPLGRYDRGGSVHRDIDSAIALCGANDAAGSGAPAGGLAGVAWRLSKFATSPNPMVICRSSIACRCRSRSMTSFRSSGRRVPGSRPCCVASTALRRSMRARYWSMATASPGRGSTSTRCAGTSASCFRATICSRT